jgi:hypothetical protein
MDRQGTLTWGWHPDPYAQHQERYISVDGDPTKLVRDFGRESYDPPPDGTAREDAQGEQRSGIAQSA